MSELFQQFPKTSKEDWIALIDKELKGADPSVLTKSSDIEEIALPAYLHSSDAPGQLSDPGAFPFTRGTNARSNDWKIATAFSLSATSNKDLLDALMAGTESLFLVDDTTNTIDFAKLLADVQLKYIELTLKTSSKENAVRLLEFAKGNAVRIVTENTGEWIAAAQQFLSGNTRPFCIDAASIKAAGANTWQEAGIALAEGHDLLVRLTEAGIEASTAVSSMSFILGIGARYFFEIAKIRAFRTCWATIAKEYAAQVNASDIHVSCNTGFTEISLKDPYTNLLRQTTHAMAAVLAGVNELVVMPYDFYSDSQNPTFTRRMATNISLLLKDESFIAIVADPSGGAYLIEELTQQITDKTWQLFLETERNGGLTDQERNRLAELVAATSKKRIGRLNAGKDKLIGVNTFPNPEKSGANWKNLPKAWNNMPVLILENEYNAAQ